MGVHPSEAMMHFPLFEISPYFRKKFQTPWKIFPISSFSKNFPHSLTNSILTPTTPGSLHTSKPLKHFVGTSSTSTSAPSTPSHLELKPSPISNQPLTDTINLSLLPNRNTTLHSFIPALNFQPSTPLESSQLSSSLQISLSTP